MRCLYCKKRLWNPFNNSQFCTELHETWYREEQCGEAIRRLMDPAAAQLGTSAAPPPSPANPEEPPPRIQSPPPLTSLETRPATPPPLIQAAPVSAGFDGPEPPLAPYLPETGQPNAPEYYIIAAELELIPNGFLAVPQADFAVMEGYDPDEVVAEPTAVPPPVGERVGLSVPPRDVPNVIFQGHSEPSSAEALFAYPLSGLGPVAPDLAALSAAEESCGSILESAPPFGGRVTLAVATELPGPPPMLAQPVEEVGTPELRIPAPAIPDTAGASEIAPDLADSSVDRAPLLEMLVADVPPAPLSGSMSLVHYASNFAQGTRILPSAYRPSFDARRMPFRWPNLSLTPAGSFLAESVDLEQFLVATSEPAQPVGPQPVGPADPESAVSVPIPAFPSAPLRETRREVTVEAITFEGFPPVVVNTPMRLETSNPAADFEAPPQAPWAVPEIRCAAPQDSVSAPALQGSEKILIRTPQPAAGSRTLKTVSRSAGIAPLPLAFPKPVLDSMLPADAVALVASVREPKSAPRLRQSVLETSGLQAIHCPPQVLREIRTLSSQLSAEVAIPSSVGLRNPSAGLTRTVVRVAETTAIALPVSYLTAPERVSGPFPALTGQASAPNLPSAVVERPRRGGYLLPAGPCRLSATLVRQAESVAVGPFEPRPGRTIAARVTLPAPAFTTRPAALDSPVMALAWRVESRKPALGAPAGEACRIRPELRIPVAS